MKYSITFVLCFLISHFIFAQKNHIFQKNENYVIIEETNNEMSGKIISLDTLYGVDDCTIIGHNVFTLSKKNIETSRPYSIYINHYTFEDGHKKEVNEYFLPSSLETIQVNFELEGGYLQLISRKSLASKGIKPHGILMPFLAEEMAGDKKFLNITLNHRNLSNLESILIKFNNW